MNPAGAADGINRAGRACGPVSLFGCANSRQGSRGVRAGAARVPPQGAGTGTRARDATALALRTAGRGQEDQEPPRPAPQNAVVQRPKPPPGGFAADLPGERGGEAPTSSV